MRTGNEAKTSVFTYDEYSHGLDYLTFGVDTKERIAPFFTDRLFDLDYDNSNFGSIRIVDEVFSIKKYKGTTGECYAFSCVYNSISIPVFEITDFSLQQSEFCNNQWGVIHFYGAFFRLIELDWFSDDLLSYIDNIFLDSPIVRIDYRFDFISYEEILDLPDPDTVFPALRKNKKRKLYFSGPRLQSWELGNKMNKTVFIRLYNKLDELAGNLKKTYLYSDIDKYKTYFRLEYEFGHKWCAGYTGKEISLLKEKVFKLSGIEPSKFEGNFYKPSTVLDLSNKIDKLRYIKIFKSMAKNLHLNGVHPITLIEEELKTLTNN